MALGYGRNRLCPFKIGISHPGPRTYTKEIVNDIIYFPLPKNSGNRFFEGRK